MFVSSSRKSFLTLATDISWADFSTLDIDVSAHYEVIVLQQSWPS
jgi:hypothetical protein